VRLIPEVREDPRRFMSLFVQRLRLGHLRLKEFGQARILRQAQE